MGEAGSVDGGRCPQLQTPRACTPSLRLAPAHPTPPLGSYPSFVDALRDLDDPLTLVHLFAVLPAEQAHGIPAAAVQKARRLALEWQAWVVRARALRKAFISVKG